MGAEGHPPEEVREAIAEAMHHDLETAEAHTGIPKHVHFEQIRTQLAHEGLHVQGPYYEVGSFFGDIGHWVNKAANSVVHAVAPIVNGIAKVIKSPIWGDIVHGLQAAVSLIPGLGTAVSNIIAAAETAIQSVEAVLSGHPLVAALRAAYNFALANIPSAAGIHIILDPYVNHLIDLAIKKGLIDSGEMNKLINSVPDKPKVAGITPRSIVASLAHILIGHLGLKNTSGKVVPKAAPTPHAKPLHVHLAPPPSPKPLGVPHAMVHAAAPLAQLPRPGPTAPSPSAHMGPGAGGFGWHCTPGPGGVWQGRWAA
jgi:hypothetical protein